jgi:phage gp36-like protein
MAFLAKSDLKLSILVDELDEITREDATIVTAALSAAEAEAKTYLFDSYDVSSIFSASGTNRHQMVLQCCVDIAIYRIVAACQAGVDMNDREVRYKSAVSWLKAVQKTENYADLPRKVPTEQVHIRWGSKTKQPNSY